VVRERIWEVEDDVVEEEVVAAGDGEVS